MGKGFYLKLWFFIILFVLIAMPSRVCNAVQIGATNVQGAFSNPVGGQGNVIFPGETLFQTGLEMDFISIHIDEEIFFDGVADPTLPSDEVEIGFMFFHNAISDFDTGATAVDLTISGDGHVLVDPFTEFSIDLTENIIIGHPDADTDTYTFTDLGLIVTVPETGLLGEVSIYGQVLPPNSPTWAFITTDLVVPEGGNVPISVDPVVPEPTTVALLGIGLVGLAGAEVRRRRKKAVDNG